MDGQDYAKHVDELCQTHGITVSPHSSGGRASRKRRAIAISPVKTAITYIVALHEIGHCLAKNHSGLRLDKEFVLGQG